MTGRKFTRAQAADRLSLTRRQLEREIASGALRLESIAGDHEVIPEQEIARYEREHPRPAVGRWSRAEDPGAFADRADHDTPSDEGDND